MVEATCDLTAQGEEVSHGRRMDAACPTSLAEYAAAVLHAQVAVIINTVSERCRGRRIQALRGFRRTGSKRANHGLRT